MDNPTRIRDQLRRSIHGDAWHGPALLEVLDGVTLAQANARPLAQTHTIGELVMHVTTWMRVAERRLEGLWPEVSDAENFPVGPADEAGWTDAVAGMVAAGESLDRAVGAASEASLSQLAPHGQYSLLLMLDGVVQHNLYHAGQIAILKKGRVE